MFFPLKIVLSIDHCFGSQHSSDTHGHTATVGAIATLCALDGDRQGEIFGDWEYQGIYGGLTIIR